ncbi:MAG: ATP-dependent DNA helicase RecG [Pseudobdellovibrionaceae bacterium]
MYLNYETNVQYLKGVGPKLGELLSKRGIRSIQNLLEYYPRAFEDRRAARNIASLRLNDVVSLRAFVQKVNAIPMGQSHRKIYDIVLKDSSGQIHCKYFRVPYKGYFERFPFGTEVRITGKVIDYRGRLEFHHPEIREYNEEEEIQDVLVPIYTEIENLNSAKILKLIRLALKELPEESWGEEKFPAGLRDRYRLVTRKEALFEIHSPPPEKSQEFAEMKSSAHRRIIFEEFFWLELYLAAKKSGLQREKGIALPEDSKLPEKLLKSLPFEMTGAQKRAYEQIRIDLQKPHPMHRLVQGDVGSGKTLVAFLAAAFTADHSYQSCLMVPTEILAEQHFKNAQKFLEPIGLHCALLTGKTKTSERNRILEELSQGKIQLLIGTHALIEEWVQFQNLALVIVDEQHRFGVEQRGKLKNKGLSPHFLVMTATPIPRTLAMTVYGDLEVSIIDEMPPGRSPIQTRSVFENKRPEALKFMHEQIQKGRQAYVVYPLVEESEKIDLKNAVEEFEKLKHQFPDVPMGLLHGKMKPSEKEEVMTRFRNNEIQILVSTTVIEVGVDVPNANLMIIEHAERFGLSQLHQLRGRVGRGSHKSFCILLMGHAVSEEARARTAMMEQTTDGFKIAEFDLEMRGPGEFLGTRQSGLPGFQMANLVRDVQILQEAREAAFEILQQDPLLKRKENQALREELLRAHGPTALAGIA